MNDETENALLEEIIEKYQISKKISPLIRQSLNRIEMINESKTFRYESLAKFQDRLLQLNKLKEKATNAFRPFANRYQTSLCASMGIPMMESIAQSKKDGNYNAIHELFGLTNLKAKRFGLAALHCALGGQKNEIPHEDTIYNIVFDRDSPWTFRNEAEHMEEYARYHFNSYLINEVENPASNPFEPVISLYEFGSADFIFMQTEVDREISEKLCTFHTINIPGEGNVLGVHMTGDKKLMHFRKWGEPYFTIHPLEGQAKLKVTGIADRRFRTN